MFGGDGVGWNISAWNVACHAQGEIGGPVNPGDDFAAEVGCEQGEEGVELFH